MKLQRERRKSTAAHPGCVLCAYFMALPSAQYASPASSSTDPAHTGPGTESDMGIEQLASEATR
eukprot:1158508-Pelagomonas_calceolata.AAC.40